VTDGLVSICVPTYNRQRYLGQCLASLRAQTGAAVEIVIADNASTDGTPALVQEAAADPRVVVLRHPQNIGLAANWASALAVASGEYVAFISDDDWCAPDFASTLQAALRAEPKACFAFTRAEVVTQDGTPAPAEEAVFNSARDGLSPGALHGLLERHLRGRQFTVTTSLFRTADVRAAGGLDPASGALVDFDLFIRLALHRDCCVFVDRPLAFYRLHAEQHTIGAGGTRRFAENVASRAVCLAKYSFPDPDLERWRRQDLAWAASCAALRLATSDPARARQVWHLGAAAGAAGPRTRLRLWLAALRIATAGRGAVRHG